MPTAADFDRLTDPVPEPGGVILGHPGMLGAVVDSENGQFRFAHNKIGINRHKFNGDVNLDSPNSLRQGMGGLPIQVWDNPLGTIPSTIFTPTPAKIIGVDIEYIELALIGSLVLGLFTEILSG